MEDPEAMSLADLDKQIAATPIPDELRSGTWAVTMLPHGKKDIAKPHYDYRYSPTYCSECRQQFRYPIVYTVQQVMPSRWDRRWTCPYGHEHADTCGDTWIKERLYTPGRWQIAPAS